MELGEQADEQLSSRDSDLVSKARRATWFCSQFQPVGFLLRPLSDSETLAGHPTSHLNSDTLYLAATSDPAVWGSGLTAQSYKSLPLQSPSEVQVVTCASDQPADQLEVLVISPEIW